MFSGRRPEHIFSTDVQPEHQHKTVPGLTRAPYDLRFSLVVLGFLWFYLVSVGFPKPLKALVQLYIALLRALHNLI